MNCFFFGIINSLEKNIIKGNKMRDRIKYMEKVIDSDITWNEFVSVPIV